MRTRIRPNRIWRDTDNALKLYNEVHPDSRFAGDLEEPRTSQITSDRARVKRAMRWYLSVRGCSSSATLEADFCEAQALKSISLENTKR